jgi:hypothetical protein
MKNLADVRECRSLISKLGLLLVKWSTRRSDRIAHKAFAKCANMIRLAYAVPLLQKCRG